MPKLNEHQKKQKEKYGFNSHEIIVDQEHSLYHISKPSLIPRIEGQTTVLGIHLYVHDKLHGNMIDLAEEGCIHARKHDRDNVDGNVAIMPIHVYKSYIELDKLANSDVFTGKQKQHLIIVLEEMREKALEETTIRFEMADQAAAMKIKATRPKTSYVKYHVHKIGTTLGVSDVAVLFAAEDVHIKVVKDRISKTNLPKVHRQLVKLKKIKGHKTQRELNKLFK